LAELVVARLQPLLVPAEENVGCPRRRDQKSLRQRARVGRGSEQVVAARKQPRKKAKVELLLPVADVFRS